MLGEQSWGPARLAVASWLDAADAALAAGDAGAAVAALAEARRLIGPGQVPGDRAGSELAAGRTEPATAGAAGALPALTPRERSLLGLLVEGCTNRQMGERLHLSEKTVRNQLSTLYAKLAIERRSQAAVLAIQLGIRPPFGDPAGSGGADGGDVTGTGSRPAPVRPL